jgi:hypothetical protein
MTTALEGGATIKFVKVGGTQKTSGSGNSDVFVGVSSVNSNKRVSVSHNRGLVP